VLKKDKSKTIKNHFEVSKDKMSGEDFPPFSSVDPLREMRDRINRDRSTFFRDDAGGPRRPMWPMDNPFTRVCMSFTLIDVKAQEHPFLVGVSSTLRTE